MKRNFILLLVLLLSSVCFSQYIVVKARYTETRLVDDAPNPPKRENRLILSFFTAATNGIDFIYTPIALSNFDLWVYKAGLQYGNNMGGVLDSTGNNYPGYAYPAPKAVAYNNSMGLNYIDCNPSIATHYIVNGNELDCGFITVSYWDVDWGTMQPIECFPAPNICLPFYTFSDPYYFNPGNINFDWSAMVPGPPYNWYNFSCGASLQLVIRGVLVADSGENAITLPIRFGDVLGQLRESNASIQWSNMTESNLAVYTIERSIDGTNWASTGTVLPLRNDGNRADYQFESLQTEDKCFYRIKATESNGHSFYSAVIVLRKGTNTLGPLETSSELSVYPNPVTGNEITFRLTNAVSGRYLSMIVTPDGRQVKQKIIEHNGGDLMRQVKLDGLVPGVYRLVLRSATDKYSQTIIVSD